MHIIKGRKQSIWISIQWKVKTGHQIKTVNHCFKTSCSKYFSYLALDVLTYTCLITPSTLSFKSATFFQKIFLFFFLQMPNLFSRYFCFCFYCCFINATFSSFIVIIINLPSLQNILYTCYLFY